MPTRIRCSSPGSRAMQPLPALRMVGDLQAPEQVVDRLERAHRRFRLLAVAQHVVGDHARPCAGDEAADGRRRAHRDHLVGDALRQVLLQHVAALGDAAALRCRRLGGAQLRLQLLGRERCRSGSGRAGRGRCRAPRRRPSPRRRRRRTRGSPTGADPRCASSPGWFRRCGRAGARPGARTNRAPRARPGRGAARRPACARSTGRKAPGSNESASSDSNRRVTSSITCRSTGSLALARTAERCCSIRWLGVPRPVSESRAAGGAAARRAAAAPARARGCAGARRRCDGAGAGAAAPAPSGTSPSSRPASGACGAGMLGSSPLERALARRLGHRPAEGRRPTAARRCDRGRARRPATRAASTPPRQAFFSSPAATPADGAQDDRALDLRGDDGAGGVPERGRVDERSKRVRLGGDVLLARPASR